ncbi:hypothetical protein WJX79_001223 [Trebouxia sp. C0005]
MFSVCLVVAAYGACAGGQELSRAASGRVHPRSLLQTAAAPASGASATIDVALLSATDAIALLCSRNITSVAYVQALFAHYDSGGFACLNSFITLNRPQVLADAAAVDAKAAAGQSITPLCGLPLAVKDSIDVQGYPTTGATPALAGHIPPYSAPLIDMYKQANGIILGKMNLAELSTSIGSINPNIPGNNITTPLNPYNQTKIPGGSSGGSAASVAARIAPWALCEDTGGSCRSPAIANGIFGLRPTLGCYNYSDGLLPATFTRDTVGAMGRTMTDLITLDSILRSSNMTSTAVGSIPDPVACNAFIDPNITLNGLRLGLPSNFGWVNPGLSSQITSSSRHDVYTPTKSEGQRMANLTNAALAKLVAAGVVLVPFDSSNLDQAIAVSWAGATESIGYELPDALSRYLFRHNYTDLNVLDIFNAINKPTIKTGYEPYINYREFQRVGSDTDWVEYLSTGRPSVAKAWRDTFAAHDVQAFLYPGSAVTVQALDAFEPAVQFDNGTVVSANTSFFQIDSISTATALAFPIGMDNTGTPAGMQISAPPGNDGLMLSLGLAMERMFGPMPAPPTTAACSGCTANVTYVPANYNATLDGPIPNATETWTSYTLTFNGQCASNYLTSYGKSGPIGRGVSLLDTTGIRSNYVNATMLVPAANISTAG